MLGGNIHNLQSYNKTPTSTTPNTNENFRLMAGAIKESWNEKRGIKRGEKRAAFRLPFFVIRLGLLPCGREHCVVRTHGWEGSTPCPQKKGGLSAALFRDPPGIRTQDPNIKSVVLCQLS